MQLMKQTSRYATVIREIMTRWEIPGLAVGVVSGSDIVYLEVFGVQSLETHNPVKPESIFCQSSVSKPFVATAIMKLVERGLLDLDTALIHYLPSLQMADERYRHITPRQLLNHTSGIPDLDESEYLELWKEREYDDRVCERLVHSLKNTRLMANPGEKYAYSNIGYNILGGLIANISGISFEEYMRDNILIPLGMKKSSFMLEDIPADCLAIPHIRAPHIGTSPIYPYHRDHNPSGGLHASVMDMCQSCRKYLEQGKTGKRVVLKPDSFEAMWTPTVGRGNLPVFRSMGLGWIVGTYQGVKTVSHMGGSTGLNSFLLIMPERDIALTLMFNTESQAIYRLLWASLNVLVDEIPHAKTVSWMLPISQALAEGGIKRAKECATKLREDKHNKEYFIEDSGLVILAHQLIVGEEADMAIAVLEINIDTFPKSVDSRVLLARALLSKGNMERAKDRLEEVLDLEPDHTSALELLEGIVAPLL